jgi:hypothetical protein
MVSQPGVSDDASRYLKLMSGTIFDENGNPKVGVKMAHAPFRNEIQAYRFCAMVGLRFDRRTEQGLMTTKWSIDAAAIKDEDFNALFSHAGRDLDYQDWVDAMNRCADWGALYVNSYHYAGGEYTLSNLIEIFTTNVDIHECGHCSVFRKTIDENCWFCTM